MVLVDKKSQRIAANSIFSTLFFVVFGLVLSQMWFVNMKASWQLEVYLLIPGLTMLGVTVYRARLHWSEETATSFDPRQTNKRLPRTQAGAWYLLLFALGFVTAALLSVGSIALLGIAGSGMSFIPWAKIPVCRARFLFSSAMILFGAVIGLTVLPFPTHPLYYLCAVWALWIIAVWMLLIVLITLDREQRIYDFDSPVTHGLERPSSISTTAS